jgi:adenylate kinase family enzyme
MARLIGAFPRGVTKAMPPRMRQRILIIGSPGSGKSTLARALAARSGLPLVHLDQIYWCPGWVERDKAEWSAVLAEALAEPRWIIEGNYGSSLAQRLRAADAVVLLHVPAWRCLWRVVKRVIEHLGRVRPDMAPGCPERFEWGFFWYTATFRHAVLPATRARLADFGGETIVLRSAREVAAFLRAA